MEGRGVNGWGCSSISNKCNWLPFKWFSPPPPWCYRPDCPQLWAATFGEWKVCLAETENEQVGTHAHAALCHHGSFIHTLTVAYVHSQLELVKIETAQPACLCQIFDVTLGLMVGMCVSTKWHQSSAWWWRTDQRFPCFHTILLH